MTITFFSNFISHHQKLVADELYKLTEQQYTFVETVPMFDWLKKGGYSDYSHELYVLRAWENEENRRKAFELAETSDIALFGGQEVLDLQVHRARHSDKLSFEVGERWLKRGALNLLSPRLLKNVWYHKTLFYKRPFYKLCASAFGAGDQYKLHTFKNKCFKWGYFTKVEDFDLEASLDVSRRGRATMLWCARFLSWKHPELPVLLAKILKDNGYEFHLDMIGFGEKFDETVALAKTLGVDDVVSFLGNMPNEEVLKQMRKHRVFLFTSDRNEGWGAVANEAMSNGCILVGSDSIGSLPFLVNDNENGLLFRSSRTNKGFTKKGCYVDVDALNSLTEKVEWVLDHPLEGERLSQNAYITMREVWSPSNAAQCLIKLIENLQQGKDSPIIDGPCSKACPIDYASTFSS